MAENIERSVTSLMDIAFWVLGIIYKNKANIGRWLCMIWLKLILQPTTIHNYYSKIQTANRSSSILKIAEMQQQITFTFHAFAHNCTHSKHPKEKKTKCVFFFPNILVVKWVALLSSTSCMFFGHNGHKKWVNQNFNWCDFLSVSQDQ